MDRLTTPARPDRLVGAWVRLRDHDRPTRPYLAQFSRSYGEPQSNP